MAAPVVEALNPKHPIPQSRRCCARLFAALEACGFYIQGVLTEDHPKLVAAGRAACDGGSAIGPP